MVKHSNSIKNKLIFFVVVILLITFLMLYLVNNAIKKHYEDIASQEGIKIS